LDDEILPYDELLENEDIEVDDSGDVSRRRLGVLKSVMKKLIFQTHDEIDEKLIKDELSDITRKEADVLIMTSNLLMPYIPSKENYNTTIYQVPFVFLANDLLRVAGCDKFTKKVCPLSSPHNLDPLRVDGVALYTICCTSGTEQFDIFDFSNIKIQSVFIARRYQDAVFNSFTDIRKITEICKMYNMSFYHSVVFLPGLKTVRLLGKKKSKQQSTIG
jgi:hypothetical protein